MTDPAESPSRFAALRAIEQAIFQAADADPTLADAQVEAALSSLIRQGRKGGALAPAPAPQTQALVARLAAVGEAQASALTADEWLACLKRIRRSVEKMTRDRGRQGYVEFLREFWGG